MKFMKMFGLAVAAAITGMALMGASSAVAGDTVLCKVHTTAACAAGDQYPSGTHVEGVSSHAVLLAGFTILCKNSVILGEALGLAKPLIGHVTKLTFEQCSGGTVTVIDQTGLLELLRTALNLGTITGNGFEVLVESFGIHCVYSGTARALHAEGGNPAVINTGAGVSLHELERGFFCPNTATWHASYHVALPKPAYIGF
jgi:hypothetical protein